LGLNLQVAVFHRFKKTLVVFVEQRDVT
jgi:hypothetical protein